mmetsp:Transcript_23565/g.58163  ORF Transcript_23565/g.58163 Transcript_23565/m.58163 type:complete len:314 (+) Transcript_23565:1665-2606(+)
MMVTIGERRGNCWYSSSVNLRPRDEDSAPSGRIARPPNSEMTNSALSRDKECSTVLGSSPRRMRHLTTSTNRTPSASAQSLMLMPSDTRTSLASACCRCLLCRPERRGCGTAAAATRSAVAAGSSAPLPPEAGWASCVGTSSGASWGRASSASLCTSLPASSSGEGEGASALAGALSCRNWRCSASTSMPSRSLWCFLSFDLARRGAAAASVCEEGAAWLSMSFLTSSPLSCAGARLRTCSLLPRTFSPFSSSARSTAATSPNVTNAQPLLMRFSPSGVAVSTTGRCTPSTSPAKAKRPSSSSLEQSSGNLLT